MISLQASNYSIKRSMFYVGMPNYTYHVNEKEGMSQSYAMETNRPYLT